MQLSEHSRRMTCRHLQSFLHAYLDREFDARERAQVEDHLAGCPACQGLVDREQAYRSLAIAPARRASTVVAPDGLRRRVQSGWTHERRSQARLRLLGLSAAAAAVALLGSSAYLYARSQFRRSLIDDAAARHARRYPLEVQEPSARKIEDWFSAKLDHRVPVPAFPNSTPVGARLLNVQNRQAAYIQYTSAGQPGNIGLFVFDDDGDADFQALPEAEVNSSHGYNVVSWRDGTIVYQLVSDLSEHDIRQILGSTTSPPAPPQSAP